MRDHAGLDPFGSPLALTSPDSTLLARYLEGRRVPVDLAQAFAIACARGSSGWLLARLLADTFAGLSESDRDDLLQRLHRGDERDALLGLLFDRVLDEVGANDPTEWAGNLRPLLTPLAAAGAGPVIPLRLLGTASARFGGPDVPARIRDVLARLGRLIVVPIRAPTGRSWACSIPASSSTSVRTPGTAWTSSTATGCWSRRSTSSPRSPGCTWTIRCTGGPPRRKRSTCGSWARSRPRCAALSTAHCPHLRRTSIAGSAGTHECTPGEVPTTPTPWSSAPTSRGCWGGER